MVQKLQGHAVVTLTAQRPVKVWPLLSISQLSLHKTHTQHTHTHTHTHRHSSTLYMVPLRETSALSQISVAKYKVRAVSTRKPG